MKQRILPLCLVLSLFAAACGDDADTATSDPGGPDTPTTLAGRGWLEGAPDEATSDDSYDAARGYDAAEEDMPAEELDYSVDGESLELRDVADEPAIEPFEPPPVDNSPLKAGSIDDAADVVAFLEYRTMITDAGVAVRPLDLSDSTVFTVTGSNGLPVLDATIEFWDPQGDRSGDPVVSLRTTADGSVRFSPHAMAEIWADLDVSVRVDGVATDVDFEWGAAAVNVSVDQEGGVDGVVPLDVQFVLDATGSMGDEINRLRDNMRQIAEQVSALPSDPDVRFGMTIYRDEGDAYVTRNFDLTGNLQEFLDALDQVVAEGGGDYPEALDEALADAHEKPAWRRDGAVELMFVIADAPPQIGRQVETPYTETAIAAAAAGVKIFPVAASGTDDQAEYAMRDIAFVTGGTFVFLSYGVDGTATGGSSDIEPQDYSELPLDQLIVQLIADELGSLDGSAGQVVTTTTTTVPPTTTFVQ